MPQPTTPPGQDRTGPPSRPSKWKTGGQTETVTEAHDVWVFNCVLSTCNATSRDPSGDGWYVVTVFSSADGVSGDVQFDTKGHFQQWVAQEM